MKEEIKSRIKKTAFWLFMALFYWKSIDIATDWEHKSTLKKIGYCEAQGRILSDDEKIRAAINKMEMGDKIRVGNKYFPKVPYDDADEILQKNPGCCKIVQRVKSGDLDIGSAGVVEINLSYKRYYRDGDETKYVMSDNTGLTGTGHMFVNSCGRADIDF